MKTPINTLLITLCCVAMILTGCQANPNRLDAYLVGDKTCGPPCWNGIVPGQTSMDDAVLTMRQLNEENGGDLSITDYGMSWREKVSGRVYTIEFQDKLVKLIQFPVNRTNLEQVIRLFGEPDYLMTGFDAKGGGRFISIYYPDKGLSFTLNPGNQKTITKDASVTYSYFVPSTNIRNEIGIIHGEEWIDRFMAEIREWKGYGDVIP